MWRIFDVPSREDITPRDEPLRNKDVQYAIHVGAKDYQARIIGVYTNPLFSLAKRSSDPKAG